MTSTEGMAKTDPLVAEFIDLLPHYGVFPALTTEEVERWVELGREAAQRSRAGDPAGAEKAYRAQIRICSLSADPYLALAFIEAGRGDEKAALADLRSAVARGFLDLQRFSRAEAATRLRKSMDLLKLEDAIPRLQRVEDDWAGWDDFKAASAPPDLASVLKVHETMRERLALIAPAIGSRQVRLWTRVIDRSTSAFLEAYVEKKKDAPDLDAALTRLMAIYAEGPVLRWEAPPVPAAQRLSAVSAAALARGDGSLRPGALMLGAIAQNANRDGKGVLRPDAARWIESSLAEVLSKYPSSPFVGIAAIGLVRTQAETGRMDRASESYKSFVAAHDGDEALLGRVRARLGALALRAGGLPAFRATTLDGAVVTPESLRGKVTVLDFWATWCRPCVDGFPTLRKIETAHGDQVAILGVSLDEIPEEELRTWIAREGLAGRHIQQETAWQSEFVEKFGVKEIPFSVVVGADGAVLAVNEHGKGLEKAVVAALARK